MCFYDSSSRSDFLVDCIKNTTYETAEIKVGIFPGNHDFNDDFQKIVNAVVTEINLK